nr:right-handed parallel beta-helix repeat-containing protein [Treponema vincentii]
MTGGSITYNKADIGVGGGVYIGDNNSATRSLFTLKDGNISYNEAKGAGGVYASGDFTMDGGVIEGNKAIGDSDPTSNTGRGGGVAIIAATMNMTGGEIKNNNALEGGGGVSLGLSGARDAVFNMSGGTISGNTLTETTGTGKGVEFFTESTEHGGIHYYTIMKMSGSAKVAQDNDVYVNESRTITVEGALENNPAAVITPKTYGGDRQVLEGTAALLSSEHAKFKVTPKDLGGGNTQQWQVDNDGKLCTETVTVTGSASERWKKLKEAVRTIADGGAIVIDGEIKATSDTDNNGEIVINKNISIKKAHSAASAVIDANSNAHRIFKVESGKTLTLDNLTLKGGNAVGATDAAGSGGAIFVQGATVRITNCTLTGNKADKNGGAVWAEKKDSSTAKVIINSSIIGGTGGDGNKVTDQDGFGGGIVINDGTLNLTDTRIIGNKAGRGGGVRTNKSTATMTRCTIESNETTGINDDDGGGGVYTHEGELTMTNCILTGNKANGAAYGGGMAIEGTTVTMTGCALKGNTASNGGGIYTRYLDDTVTPKTAVTIDGGTIGGTQSDEANKATGSSDGFGGGIFVDKNYIVTLKGSVQVIGNTAKDGGGVYAGENSTFKMYDSSIANNTGTTGKGVYVKGGDGTPSKIDAVFIMGGAACVGKWVAGTLQDGNDVYLGENGGSGNLVSIKIDKDKPITQPKAARITPKNHAPDEIVLRMWNSLDNSSPTTGGVYNDKFTVTPQTFPAQQWEVTGDGQLQRKP